MGGGHGAIFGKRCFCGPTHGSRPRLDFFTYGFRVTFVDPQRFRETCYNAAGTSKWDALDGGPARLTCGQRSRRCGPISRPQPLCLKPPHGEVL